MPTDDGWEDIAQDDDGWEDIPAAAAPKPAAFASLRGSKIEAEPSWWEKVKGFSSGFGKNLTSLGVRAADAVANSNLSPVPNIDPLGRINNAERLRKIEAALGVAAPQDGERVAPGERTGRAVAAMVPQVGVGIASAGQSIPMQALIAGASQSGQSLLEGLSPQEALTAGATSAGFAGLGGGVSRLMAPAGGAVRTGVVQAGERLGLDLPASVKTGSRAVQYLEGAASKVPGGQRIVDRATKAADDLSEIGSSVSRSAADNAPLTGETMAEGVKRAKAEFDAVKAMKYARADVKGIPVVPGSLREIDRMLAEGTMKPSDLAFLERLRKRIAPKPVSPGTQGPPTPRDATRVWSEQRGLADAGWQQPGSVPMGSPALRRKLSGSLKDDLRATVGAERPASLQAMNEADAFFSANAPKVNSPAANTVTRLASQGRFDLIPGNLIHAKTSAADVANIMALAPDAADGIRESVLARIMKDAAPSGKFTPQGMARQVQKWTPKKLQEILTPEQWQQVQALATVTEAYGEMARITKGSPTAGLAQWALPAAGLGASVGEGDATPFAKSLLGLAAVYGGSRFVGSPLGQKWLTSGIPGARAAGTGVGLTGRAATAGIGSAVADERRKRDIRRSTNRE
jgi:hypothetical protein